MSLEINLDLEKVQVEHGECYRNCVRVLLKNLAVPGWVLVHGIVTGTGGNARGLRMGHAWLEKQYIAPGFPGIWMVYDPSCDGFVIRDIYYAFANVEYTVRYSQTEMALLMLRENSPGPWDLSVAQAWHNDDPT